MIRGALIQRYLQQQGLSEDQAMDDACCRQLFFGNSVAFLHAYPLHAHGKRMLPTPSAWRVAKDERNREPTLKFMISLLKKIKRSPMANSHLVNFVCFVKILLN